MTEQAKVLALLPPGRFACSPYFAQLVSEWAPERYEDVTVERTWKRWGEGGTSRNALRVEPA